MRPQLLKPGDTFHAARINGAGNYVLLDTSVWVRAEPADVEIGKFDELASRDPTA